jgi:hypothetical protein
MGLFFCIGVPLLLLLIPWWNGLQRRRALAERQRMLAERFGQDIAVRIMRRDVWQDQTLEMLLESRGKPVDVKERVWKARTKHTLCYDPIGKNRYALRIHLEDGIVVGWDG